MKVQARHLLLAWIVVFTVAAAYALRENRQRISDIRSVRIVSCHQTYEGVREIFRPFFPPAPRTVKQQRDLDKFNRTIDQLKTRCH